MKWLPVFLVFIFAAVITLSQNANTANINAKGATLGERIMPPKGYVRVAEPEGSFGAYLRGLKLKPDGAKVHYFNGREKMNNNLYAAVVDMNIGNKDLQQCADVIMHARAEYLYNKHEEDKIHFTLTNGFRADYSKWKAGYRIKVSGNTTTWAKTAAPCNTYQCFCSYMDVIYNYCGTLSLSKELVKVPYANMQPGDVLIKGGSPGHAELVMDMAQGKDGKKAFLLSQSYMPAQEMQVLTNRVNRELSPWYELNAANPNIITPEWDFTTSQLMRFAD